MDTRLQTIEILKDFHKITGARISLHDLNFSEIAGYPDELSCFCTRIQQIGEVRAKCKETDKAAFREVQQTGKPYTYKCHCGLIETVAPIYNYGTLTGYFMMGQITDNIQESLSTVKKNSAQYFSDSRDLNDICGKIPVIPTDMLDSYINILEIIAEYMTQTNRLTAKDRDLASAVKSYIAKFYARPFSVRALCETFNCSRTTLMNAFKEKYGVTIGRYITDYRLNQAKKMLEESERSIKTVAIECGFSDQNYFAHVFRSNFGVTPGKYRNSAVSRKNNS